MDSNEKSEFSLTDMINNAHSNRIEITGGGDETIIGCYDSLRMSPSSEYQLTDNIQSNQQHQVSTSIKDSSTFVIDYNVPVFGLAIDSTNNAALKTNQISLSLKTFLSQESFSSKIESNRKQQYENDNDEMHTTHFEEINSAGTSSSSSSTNNNSVHLENLDDRLDCLNENGVSNLKSSSNGQFDDNLSQINRNERDKSNDNVGDTSFSQSYQPMLEESNNANNNINKIIHDANDDNEYETFLFNFETEMQNNQLVNELSTMDTNEQNMNAQNDNITNNENSCLNLNINSDDSEKNSSDKNLEAESDKLSPNAKRNLQEFNDEAFIESNDHDSTSNNLNANSNQDLQEDKQISKKSKLNNTEESNQNILFIQESNLNNSPKMIRYERISITKIVKVKHTIINRQILGSDKKITSELFSETSSEDCIRSYKKKKYSTFKNYANDHRASEESNSALSNLMMDNTKSDTNLEEIFFSGNSANCSSNEDYNDVHNNSRKSTKKHIKTSRTRNHSNKSLRSGKNANKKQNINDYVETDDIPNISSKDFTSNQVNKKRKISRTISSSSNNILPENAINLEKNIDFNKDKFISQSEEANTQPCGEIKEEPENSLIEPVSLSKKNVKKTKKRVSSITVTNIANRSVSTGPKLTEFVTNVSRESSLIKLNEDLHLKKYPPRYLTNNRYQKISGEDEEIFDLNQTNKKYAIKTRNNSKTASNLNNNAPKPSNTSAVFSISDLKFDLNPKEKRQDLEKLKNIPMSKIADSMNPSLNNYAVDSTINNDSFNLIGANEENSFYQYLNNKAPQEVPFTHNLQIYDNANVVQNEVTIDYYEESSETPGTPKQFPTGSHIETDKSLNSSFQSIPHLVNQLALKHECFTNKCFVNLSQLDDETINLYIRKPTLKNNKLKTTTNSKTFRIKDRVFAPVSNNGIYRPAIIKNKHFANDSYKINAYTCKFFKINDEKSPSQFDDDSDDEIDTELYKIIEANEIMPYSMLEKSDNLLANTNGQYIQVNFISNIWEANSLSFMCEIKKTKEKLKIKFNNIAINRKDALKIFNRKTETTSNVNKSILNWNRSESSSVPPSSSSAAATDTECETSSSTFSFTKCKSIDLTKQSPQSNAENTIANAKKIQRKSKIAQFKSRQTNSKKP